MFNDAKTIPGHLFQKEQKPMKINYLAKICDVKMYLAKIKGWQRYGIIIYQKQKFTPQNQTALAKKSDLRGTTGRIICIENFIDYEEVSR